MSHHRVGDDAAVVECQFDDVGVQDFDLCGVRGGLHLAAQDVGQEGDADIVAARVAVWLGVNADEAGDFYSEARLLRNLAYGGLPPSPPRPQNPLAAPTSPRRVRCHGGSRPPPPERGSPRRPSASGSPVLPRFAPPACPAHRKVTPCRGALCWFVPPGATRPASEPRCPAVLAPFASKTGDPRRKRVCSAG